MAKVVIIGAGFAGHTAALYLGDGLGREHEITVINRGRSFCYLPSLVWLGMGHMAPEKMMFPLRPVYGRYGIRFIQGRATEIHPDENHVIVRPADGTNPRRLDYDYLIVATGPHLDYAGTPGLGPDEGHTESICWIDHAIRCRSAYRERVERMRRGERVRFVIGAGHALTTCQGAAFEYLANVHLDLVRKGLRDRAEFVWLSNEPAAGDFAVDGVRIKRRGRTLTSDAFVQAIFEDFGVQCEIGRAVKAVDETRMYWEDSEGREGETPFDFAMMIPRFRGPRLRWVGRGGEDISGRVVNAAGFVLVDGYYGMPHDQLVYTPEAWPATYRNPSYPNIFAPGISFAVPGSISTPHVTPRGTEITATAPRTGMVSATIGRLVAMNVIGLVREGRMRHQARMTEMFAACIASVSDSLRYGSGVSVVVMPVVPNYMRYPETYGRDPFSTHIEAGLAGAWMKYAIHLTMLHKLQARPGWKIIPE